MSKSVDGPILFFDGVCGLCSKFVDFLFKIDKKGVYRVAPLQGQTAKALLPKDYTDNLKSLIVWRNHQILLKSEAVLAIIDDIGGGWKFILLFRIIPRFIRDKVYDFIAKYRYKVFGQKSTCRLPSADEQKLFLP
ncbi:MAG: DUF393 domain-containing protein [Bdellovibrionales bacterium]|nr:DUF393 domain-containing protein [Bdellovibrionales bacterium]